MRWKLVHHINFQTTVKRCVSSITPSLQDQMTTNTRLLAESLTILEPETPEILLRRRMALARAITLVESTAPSHKKQADLLLTHLLQKQHDCFRLGITGPPGAGKSTFIEALGNYVLNDLPSKEDNTQSLFSPSRLAVLCIDPSSSVTGGSILGDKTRMTELSRHHKAYVRPSANGGTFGGLSAYTHDVVSLCAAASYDWCVVETVGLGQSEIEVVHSVDMLLLIVPPGGGDQLQGVKKGIVEVADAIMINKADGNLLPAARNTTADYRGAMNFMRQKHEQWKVPPVLLASSLTGEGIPEVWNEISRYRTIMMQGGELAEKRRQQSRYWMWKNLQKLISERARVDPALRQTAEKMEIALSKGTITPRVAASELLASLIH
jgi:LAO/AO transport system kinase